MPHSKTPDASLIGCVVIFDLDGTLVDTAEDLAAAMNHVLGAEGHDGIPPQQVRHLVGFGAKAMLARGYELLGATPKKNPEQLLEQFLDYYWAHIADRSRPFPDVLEAIDILKKDGAKIAICTNKREASARLLIETLGLTALFDVIVGADTAAAPKPDPAPVQLCLHKTSADYGVFVGDSDTDIKAAMAAKTPCLAATFGYGPLDLVEEAYALFDNYKALPGLVRDAARQRTKGDV